MFTIECCLLVGLWLGFGLVFGWLEGMHSSIRCHCTRPEWKWHAHWRQLKMSTS